MRVVAGKFRHRLLTWPDDIKTRPTKDIVREALFNSLGLAVDGAVVLDLFAGSGSLGIESLSRGAAFCYFVDDSKEAYRCVSTNLKTLKIENAQVIFMDYIRALKQLRDKKIQFNLVLLDPPYAKDNYQMVIDFLFANEMLSENAIIALESDHSLALADSRFAHIKEYKYGITYVTIMRR